MSMNGLCSLSLRKSHVVVGHLSFSTVNHLYVLLGFFFKLLGFLSFSRISLYRLDFNSSLNLYPYVNNFGLHDQGLLSKF